MAEHHAAPPVETVQNKKVLPCIVKLPLCRTCVFWRNTGGNVCRVSALCWSLWLEHLSAGVQFIFLSLPERWRPYTHCSAGLSVWCVCAYVSLSLSLSLSLVCCTVQAARHGARSSVCVCVRVCVVVRGHVCWCCSARSQINNFLGQLYPNKTRNLPLLPGFPPPFRPPLVFQPSCVPVWHRMMK